MKLSNKIKVLLALTVITSSLVGCSSGNKEDKKPQEQQQTISTSDKKDDSNENLETEKEEVEENKDENSQGSETNTTDYNTLGFAIDENNLLFNNKAYKIINVDGGDRSGNRQNNVAIYEKNNKVKIYNFSLVVFL